MKTIVATAYAINPYKGSEDGMGWNFVLQIARFNNVVAITRENNRPSIEKYIAENPNVLYSRISFLYFDLPYWMRFWKKGGRGAMLYYYMWQVGIVPFIKKQRIAIDIVHNLNFHNDWTPSFLWRINKPFVWGPIGHHPLIPSDYLKPFANSYLIKDRLTWLVKKYFWTISISLNKTKRKANHILCMNSSVAKVLNLKDNFSIIPSVATQDFGWKNNNKTNEAFTLISAGRFVPLKGFDLTIRSFAKFMDSLNSNQKKNCKLLLIGSGPEKKLFQSIANELNVEQYIEFISWIERDQLMEQYKNSSVFLFPSHEGAGMVVAEALSFGLPVICLNNEGPGEFIHSGCGFAIQQNDYNTTVDDLSKSIATIYHSEELKNKMSKAARQQFENKFHWDRRGEQLQKIYADL